jgi:hypothetical protein
MHVYDKSTLFLLICTRISKRKDYFTKENDTRAHIQIEKEIAIWIEQMLKRENETELVD